jgi:hypothetical protein
MASATSTFRNASTGRSSVTMTPLPTMEKHPVKVANTTREVSRLNACMAFKHRVPRKLSLLFFSRPQKPTADQPNRWLGEHARAATALPSFRQCDQRRWCRRGPRRRACGAKRVGGLHP